VGIHEGAQEAVACTDNTGHGAIGRLAGIGAGLSYSAIHLHIVLTKQDRLGAN